MRLICSHTVSNSEMSWFGDFPNLPVTVTELHPTDRNARNYTLSEVLKMVVDTLLVKINHDPRRTDKNETYEYHECFHIYNTELADAFHCDILKITLASIANKDGIVFGGYINKPSDGEYLRIFGYDSENTDFFEMECVHVFGMEDGMDFQFINDFEEIVPLESIDVHLNTRDWGLEAPFWMTFEEAILGNKVALSKYLETKLLEVSSDNIQHHMLLTDSGNFIERSVTRDSDIRLIVRKLVTEKRLSVNEVNNMHYHNRVAADAAENRDKILKGFGFDL